MSFKRLAVLVLLAGSAPVWAAAPVEAPRAGLRTAPAAPTAIPALPAGLGPTVSGAGHVAAPAAAPGSFNAPAAPALPPSVIIPAFELEDTAPVPMGFGPAEAASIRTWEAALPRVKARSPAGASGERLRLMAQKIEAELAPLTASSDLESAAQANRRVSDILSGQNTAQASGVLGKILSVFTGKGGKKSGGSSDDGAPPAPPALSNPARLYPTALELAGREAEKYGRKPEQLYFAQAAALLGRAADRGWKFTFYLTESPERTQADQIEVQFTRNAQGAADGKAVFYNETHVHLGARLRRFTPEAYAQSSALSLEEARVKAGPAAAYSLEVEQKLDRKAATEDDSLWYYFHGPAGLTAAVNAKDGSTSLVAPAAAPSTQASKGLLGAAFGTGWKFGALAGLSWSTKNLFSTIGFHPTGWEVAAFIGYLGLAAGLYFFITSYGKKGQPWILSRSRHFYGGTLMLASMGLSVLAGLSYLGLL